MPPSRKEELVEAATRVFDTNGYHASGLDLILQESGVSRMTLYNHFASKDELIVAAMRRRDENFRNALIKHVERASDDPREQLLAVFDHVDAWINSDGFEGCMFIHAGGEFHDRDSGARHAAAEHKLGLERMVKALCEKAGAADPARLARDLDMLIQGAIVQAHLVDRQRGETSDAAQRAKDAAEVLIERSTRGGRAQLRAQ